MAGVCYCSGRSRASVSSLSGVLPACGKVIHQGVAAQHRSTGTTVSVRELFYCLPVRRRDANATVEFERVRQRLMRLLLVWPGVAASLTDSARSLVVLTRPRVRAERERARDLCAGALLDSSRVWDSSNRSRRHSRTCSERNSCRNCKRSTGARHPAHQSHCTVALVGGFTVCSLAWVLCTVPRFECCAVSSHLVHSLTFHFGYTSTACPLCAGYTILVYVRWHTLKFE